MKDSNKIISEIRSILSKVGNSLPVENIHDAEDLLEHNEWGESLSLICTQLYEYDITINQDMYEKIASLGREIDMPSKEWSVLQELVKKND